MGLIAILTVKNKYLAPVMDPLFITVIACGSLVLGAMWQVFLNHGWRITLAYGLPTVVFGLVLTPSLSSALFFTDVLCDDYQYIMNPRIAYMMGTFSLARNFPRVDVVLDSVTEGAQVRREVTHNKDDIDAVIIAELAAKELAAAAAGGAARAKQVETV